MGQRLQQKGLAVFDQQIETFQAMKSFTAFGCNRKILLTNAIAAWKVLSLRKWTSFSLTLARINCFGECQFCFNVLVAPFHVFFSARKNPKEKRIKLSNIQRENNYVYAKQRLLSNKNYRNQRFGFSLSSPCRIIK